MGKRGSLVDVGHSSASSHPTEALGDDIEVERAGTRGVATSDGRESPVHSGGVLLQLLPRVLGVLTVKVEREHVVACDGAVGGEGGVGERIVCRTTST